MNHKNIFYFLLTALLTASLSAEAPNKQQLQEQLEAKQQELSQLSQKITAQEDLIDESYRKIDACIKNYISRKGFLWSGPNYDELFDEVSNVYEKFLQNSEKGFLFDEFFKSDPKLAFAKFHFLRIFYERIPLKNLIQKWEETARQVNALLGQIRYLDGQ